jgi:hypothetical protein
MSKEPKLYRILALLDGPEQEVVYGTLEYDEDRERAWIFVEGDEEDAIRVHADDILEVTDDDRRPMTVA